MKNTINYYYNLNINTIHQKEKNYYFKADNKNYLLLKCTNIEEPDDIYRLNIYLSQILPVHRIVLNANNEAITKINDSNYLLLELFSNNNKINLNNIIELSNIRIPFSVDKLKRNDWYNLWIKKVDYFDAVVLIKSGKFYVTFDYDAEIIHKLLTYKIVHHRILLFLCQIRSKCHYLRGIRHNRDSCSRSQAHTAKQSCYHTSSFHKFCPPFIGSALPKALFVLVLYWMPLLYHRFLCYCIIYFLFSAKTSAEDDFQKTLPEEVL